MFCPYLTQYFILVAYNNSDINNNQVVVICGGGWGFGDWPTVEVQVLPLAKQSRPIFHFYPKQSRAPSLLRPYSFSPAYFLC